MCGIGVTSRMARTSSPAVCKARIAESRPEPGPFTLTSRVRIPASRARFAAVSAACWAANGVPFREPLKPRDPALDQQTTLPSRSAMVTVVLLNVAWMCATPDGTIFFSFFFAPFFFGWPAINHSNYAVAAVYDRRRSRNLEIAGGHRPPLQFMSLTSPSCGRRLLHAVDLCASAHWYACAAHARVARGDAGARDTRRFPSDA